MKIITSFPGANAVIDRVDGDTVYLRPDLRDTARDWFYWCFAVSGAKGRTVSFRFDSDIRVGYYGPAVSRDLVSFRWLNGGQAERDRFTFSFRDDGTVFFAHDMLYRPERLEALRSLPGVCTGVLCISPGGREVPYFTIGNGERSIVLTARHHACESTGSYVLDGIIRAMSRRPPAGCTVFCVPMVDLDGVTAGDQGKDRAPHDHNRDYGRDREPVYPEVRALRKYIDTHRVIFGLDCHSPYHLGGEHDTVYVVRKDTGKYDRIARFSELLEQHVTKRSLPYRAENDRSSRNAEWVSDECPDFAGYVLSSGREAVACALETTYFGMPGSRFSPARALELGRCAARALCRFAEEG